MKRRILAGIVTAVLLISLAACGAGEKTTVSGMVTAVEGTVVSIVQMDGNRGQMNGQRPSQSDDKGERPEGFGGQFNGELPEGFEGKMPEDFNGQLPEGFEGQRPNGGNFPGWGENGERPTLPEGETMPSMPENGERPSFEGGDGKNPGFGNFTENMDVTQIDIGNAHISVETDGVKASGSMADIKAGTFVTITKNGKGQVTNVLVTTMSGFGGKWQGTGSGEAATA